MYKPSEKNKIYRVDSGEHWPTSIKDMKNNNRLISSLLKVFAMFEIRLSYEDEKLDVLSLKCLNCKIETGLYSETSFSWVFD